MVTRWFVEIDPHCRNVLARHWPGLPVYGDISAVDWSGVEPVDVLAGGFPCQPISAAGKRLAQADARWLWPEFARAVRALRPRYVLVENVRNLLAVNGGSAFAEILADLAGLGYDAEWQCIPAAAVGAPHRRDRLWLVAYAASAGERPRRLRPMGQRSDAAGRSARTVAPVADADGSRQRSDRAAVSSRQSDAAGSGEHMADADGQRGPRRRNASREAEGRRPLSAAQRRGDVPDAVFTGLEGHERAVVALEEFRRSHADPAGSGWWAAEPDVGRVADGFPHRVDRLRALGNAVVPQVVEWIGRRIVAFDEARRTVP